ncbi:MAG: aminopeptidase, partial [Phycisphaerae bacterium]|nr:aminopeptidase [Phycisphaerae bacterium]
WPDGRLAELLFHELAHQKLYIPDDTVFNESFASAVGQLGAQLWLQDKPQALQSYQLRLGYRK